MTGLALRTVADVAAVCEAAGMTRMAGPDVRSNVWVRGDVEVAASGAALHVGGVHVRRALGGGDGGVQVLATVYPRTPDGAVVLRMVLAAVSLPVGVDGTRVAAPAPAGAVPWPTPQAQDDTTGGGTR